MDATSYLIQIADGLQAVGLEAILIGNAAAAMQGAPITTIDLDFFYRDTKLNVEKVKKLADYFGAKITQPFPQLSTVYRMVLPQSGLHIDFLAVMDGVSSLASLRSRASRVSIEGRDIWVASLDDVIRSKKMAGRPKDLAVMHVLEEALRTKDRKIDP